MGIPLIVESFSVLICQDSRQIHIGYALRLKIRDQAFKITLLIFDLLAALRHVLPAQGVLVRCDRKEELCPGAFDALLKKSDIVCLIEQLPIRHLVRVLKIIEGCTVIEPAIAPGNDRILGGRPEQGIFYLRIQRNELRPVGEMILKPVAEIGEIFSGTVPVKRRKGCHFFISDGFCRLIPGHPRKRKRNDSEHAGDKQDFQNFLVLQLLLRLPQNRK